jgi:Leucine-rich repeat (LRR) protein
MENLRVSQPNTMPDRVLPSCIPSIRARPWRVVRGWLLIFPLLALAVSEPASAQAPQTDTAKWLTTNDARWQAAYQRDVAGPFEKGAAELRRQYLLSLAAPAAAANQAGRSEEAAIWNAERELVSSGGDVLAADDASAPSALKALRKNYREQYALLDKQRFGRARALFGSCEAVLARSQAALAERNRTNESAAVQKERDRLSAAWLQPPFVAAATPSQSAGGAAAPAKLPPRQTLEKLLALGAAVNVKVGKGETTIEAKSAGQIGGENFTFVRVELRAQRADGTPLVAADYAILDSLSDLPELSLSGGNVTDAVLEKLRAYRNLQTLTLDGVSISATSYNLLAALPELRELWLGNTGTDNEGLKTIARHRKLKILHLVALPITDDGLAAVSKMPALEELELNALDKLDLPGFAHLAESHSLKQIYASGFTIISGMLENLAHCKNLEVVSMPGSLLNDADIASLGTLAKLRTLDLSGSKVTGAAFATWSPHSQLTGLNLHDAAGVNDAILKNIEHAFPKVEDLDLKLAATGFSGAGATLLGKLRSLHTLRLSGAGVTDEAAAQLAHCDGLTLLAIPAARLTDLGVAALAKLPNLAELSIDVPPLTGGALKSFGRCKQLKTFNIGKDAPPETENKLKGAVSGLIVNRPAAE